MSDITNLIYNGDFSNRTDSWTGNGVTVSDGVLTVTGNLHQSLFIPVGEDRRYRISFDLKINSASDNNWYSCLYPYDNNKTSISIAYTNKPIANTETTLASAIANGDTTVTLTSSANWTTTRAGRGIGICNKLAWGYNRATYRLAYTTIDQNILTLKSAWAGGSFPAGTKVANFEGGSTYYYPIYMTKSALPTDWTSYSKEFYGRDIRPTCQYVQFHTLGYSHNYSMRNLRLECISDYQECPYYDHNITPQINKSGIVQLGNFIECNMPARYVRDSTTGSTENSYNHWCEFEVFNSVGSNIALGKDIKFNNTVYSNSVATDGIINSSYVPSGFGGTTTALIDLGYVEDISKIKIWHYYPDGRTYYNNITEVSVDGEKWFTVYQGEKPETSSGNEIILSPQFGSIYENGRGYFNEFIEY